MSHESALGDRIYRALKDAVLAGTLSQHVRLDFAELAEIHGVSTTPVREAVMRLLGEGLIELHPKGGARPARYSEFRLRALLDLHARLVKAALDGSSIPVAPEWATALPNEARARALFGAVAQATGNPEFADMMERVGDWLAPFRRQEDHILTGVAEELDALRAALSDPAALRRGLRRYHRRRLAVVGGLIWTLGAAA